MKSTFRRIAAAGVACLSMGLAASALAQDRPAVAGRAGSGLAPGPLGPRGADRPNPLAETKQRREQRLQDLLQIRPDQEPAFRTFLITLEQGRPQLAPGAGPRRQDGPGGFAAADRERLTTPERLDRMAQRMAERQQRTQKTVAAVKSFYAVLSPEQRKAFDALPVMRIGDGPGAGLRRAGRMMRDGFGGPPPGPVR